jgi:hypothetical protein
MFCVGWFRIFITCDCWWNTWRRFLMEIFDPTNGTRAMHFHLLSGVKSNKWMVPPAWSQQCTPPRTSSMPRAIFDTHVLRLTLLRSTWLLLLTCVLPSYGVLVHSGLDDHGTGESAVFHDTVHVRPRSMDYGYQDGRFPLSTHFMTILRPQFSFLAV